MYKIISSLFEKMGNWFGIVFKMIIPFFVMYRPLKAFVFSCILLETADGGNFYFFSRFGFLVFVFMYIILMVLLIFFPKVASAVEFVLIIWYFAFLIYLGVSDFSVDSAKNAEHLIITYSQELPLVILFLAGKLFVFFFVRAHSKEYETKQDRIKERS